jgi:hypothetical protein
MKKLNEMEKELAAASNRLKSMKEEEIIRKMSTVRYTIIVIYIVPVGEKY